MVENFIFAFMKKLLFFIALAFLACSDDSSTESTISIPAPESSDSELQQSSSSVLDTFVEYVEPPMLSCESVESIILESKIDTSYKFYSFGFYGDDMIAIPRHPNLRGSYGHEDDVPSDTFYVKKNGEASWQKRAAFENYWYQQEGKLCIVGENLAIIRAGENTNFKDGKEICHSGDGENWSCDSLPEMAFLTCDDKYFYKAEKSGTLAYSENAIDWTPINFRFEGGIHSLRETFTSDTARIVVVNYNKRNEYRTDFEWRVAILYSKDMISWDTTDVMYGVANGAARLGNVYVLGIGSGGNGFIYYSKNLKNWNVVNQVNGDYLSNTVHAASMAVSNGVLIVVGGYGYIFSSRNGKDFRKFQGACGIEMYYSSVIADSQGNFYALHNDVSYPDKYEIIRVEE